MFLHDFLRKRPNPHQLTTTFATRPDLPAPRSLSSAAVHSLCLQPPGPTSLVRLRRISANHLRTPASVRASAHRAASIPASRPRPPAPGCPAATNTAEHYPDSASSVSSGSPRLRRLIASLLAHRIDELVYRLPDLPQLRGSAFPLPSASRVLPHQRASGAFPQTIFGLRRQSARQRIAPHTYQLLGHGRRLPAVLLLRIRPSITRIQLPPFPRHHRASGAFPQTIFGLRRQSARQRIAPHPYQLLGHGRRLPAVLLLRIRPSITRLQLPPFPRHHHASGAFPQTIFGLRRQTARQRIHTSFSATAAGSRLSCCYEYGRALPGFSFLRFLGITAPQAHFRKPSSDSSVSPRASASIPASRPRPPAPGCPAATNTVEHYPDSASSVSSASPRLRRISTDHLRTPASDRAPAHPYQLLGHGRRLPAVLLLRIRPSITRIQLPPFPRHHRASGAFPQTIFGLQRQSARQRIHTSFSATAAGSRLSCCYEYGRALPGFSFLRFLGITAPQAHFRTIFGLRRQSARQRIHTSFSATAAGSRLSCCYEYGQALPGFSFLRFLGVTAPQASHRSPYAKCCIISRKKGTYKGSSPLIIWVCIIMNHFLHPINMKIRRYKVSEGLLK